MTVTLVNPPKETEPKKKPGAGKQAAPQEAAGFDLLGYFKGVRQEWSKISWPGRPQIIAETGVVLVVVAIFSLFVFVVDKLFQFLIQWIT